MDMIEKKIVLVTGANKGIGYEIVRQLARYGFVVILTSRDKAKGIAAQDQLKKEDLPLNMYRWILPGRKVFSRHSPKLKRLTKDWTY
jgi:NAD(P)-dependent dehydrogenase (short-subunit alcohol dehydrogenase family)